MQEDPQSPNTFSPEQFKESEGRWVQGNWLLSSSQGHVYMKQKKKTNPYRRGTASFFPAPLISE